MNSFVTIARNHNVLVEIDDTFDTIETPSGMRDIELYPHQKTSVRALLDIEDKRVVRINVYVYTNRWIVATDSSTGIHIETSGAVLSERFGSGKTIIILAMILHRPVPKAYPTHVNAVIINNPGHATDRIAHGVQRITAPFRHEVRRQFIGEGALLRPNLIVVGSSVLAQWEAAIANYTNLHVFIISDYYSLKRFYTTYCDGLINQYDIVLLKNGTATGNFTWMDDSMICPAGQRRGAARDHRGLISLIGDITRADCWARVIYDDFDTISIPAGSTAVNALFSIYVSATIKLGYMGDAPLVTYKSILEALNTRELPLNYITTDHALFTTFNVRNTGPFVDNSLSIPIVEGYQYVYDSDHENYMKLMLAMRDDDINSIVEMLNGGAVNTAAKTIGIKIDTAAELMGIKSKSVADIFQRMLNDRYDRYLNDQYILDTVDKFVAGLTDGPATYSIADLDVLRALLIEKQVPKMPYNRSQALEQMINALITEYRAAKERDGVAINRVISNIKEGTCQICKLELTDFHVFILRCCGIIVCDDCGIKGNKIKRRYDEQHDKHVWHGHCANCMRPVYPARDLIFVDKSFSIEKLLEARGDEDDAILDESDTPDEQQEDNNGPINPKIRALLAIIDGREPESRERIAVKIKCLLVGRVDRPQPDHTARKIIVFAGFDETLALIEEAFVTHNVTYLRLGSKHKDIAMTVARFRSDASVTVLLINSQLHCAGLNLEFATDLVYFHKIINDNVEAQVAGRAQRIGRSVNLRIHYLKYKNEQ